MLSNLKARLSLFRLRSRQAKVEAYFYSPNSSRLEFILSIDEGLNR